jgi:hypothetical protein
MEKQQHIPGATTDSIHPQDEAAMTATFQFIDFLTQHPDHPLSTSFRALWTGAPDAIVTNVNDFLSQHTPYTICTFQHYMMGISFAARTSARKEQPLPQTTYSLSRLMTLLGGAWPGALPDIILRNLNCSTQNGIPNIQAEIDEEQLPAGSALSLKHAFRMTGNFSFPPMQLNGRISLLELTDHAVTADISAEGIRFTLDFGSMLTQQMNCNVSDHFSGEFKFSLSRRIHLPGIAGASLGSIPLRALTGVYINIRHHAGDIVMTVSGDLYFEGQMRRFGNIEIDARTRQLSDILEAIGDHIEKNALQLFEDLAGAAEPWARNVRRTVIAALNPVGDVLKHAFGKGAADVARIMRQAGFAAAETAAALKNSFEQDAGQAAALMHQAGYTAGETVSALKSSSSLATLASILRNVFGLSINNINDILQQAGYSAHAIEDAFKSLGGDFAHFAKKVWDKLNPSHWLT